MDLDLHAEPKPGSAEPDYSAWGATEAPSADPLRRNLERLYAGSEKIAGRLFADLFNRLIHRGSLTLLMPGETYRFGSGQPAVTVRIHDRTVVLKILANPDLAIGEAYMDGLLTVEDGDIYDFLDLCLSNIGSGRSHWLQRGQRLLRRVGRRVQQYNPVGTARDNVAHHYDLGDQLYELFLDEDRQYSCGYFVNPKEDTLEEAQLHKKNHIIAKLLLHSGQRVLDIGCGWGGLAMSMAQHFDVNVTGVTLSTEQHAYAEGRALEAQLSDRVRFLMQDYREVSGRFDRIVSVGMFEHVGVNHYGQFFDAVHRLLTDDGVALLHTIGSADGPGSAHPWINKYIFPGGYAPALSEITPIIERSGLYITDVEVWRLHYAYTLRHWRERFMKNRARVAALYDERFCRMWEFYLAGCEATFRHNAQVVFQIQLSKRIDAVPMTRDYMGKTERRLNR
jgi:cyclopropane-fatty-acyl-phospholipid synthase